MSASKKIGLVGLTAMVFGSMIGGGIFNIPQNMAAQSALGPVLIAWGITAIGMLGLAFVFKILADERPDLNIGIYSYAKEGFGRYVGFNSAWGYWLASVAGNVAFAIMLNDSLGHYFPIFLKHGIPTALLGLALIWMYNFLVLGGIKQASFVNTITVVIKFIALLVIIVMMVLAMHIDWLTIDFWGQQQHLGSIAGQVKAPMLVTLWCFIGIEGAVVISNKAQKPSQVGIATVLGFLVAFILYVVISVLPYAIEQQPELAKLLDPSAGYILSGFTGGWFVDFVTISVLISVGGAWLAWTVLMAQLPYAAAVDGNFPKQFTKENDKDVPNVSLWVSSIAMSIFMVLAITAKDVYMASINITSVIILPSYLLSAMFLWKSSHDKSIFAQDNQKRRKALFIGILATLYCCWLVYSAGLSYLLVATILYAIGIIPFYIAGKQQGLSLEKIFPTRDAMFAIMMVALAILAIVLLAMGEIVL